MTDYPDISGITGSADRNNIRIENNYRFDALVRAIDFFTQKFNLDTLIDFAGDFINEILTLGASAEFVYEPGGDYFKVRKSRLYKCKTNIIPNSRNLQDIAVLHGSIITGGFEAFFSKLFLEEYEPVLLIPLIHADGLIGFIISSGKAIGEFDDDDYGMAKAIMHLFNSSFERNYLIEQQMKSERQLDNTIFELSTVKKTSKVLFAEIELDQLLITGLEIFSEVSGSRVTAFAIIDTDENSLIVKAFKDARKNTKCPDDFHLYFCDKPALEKDKYVFEVETEMEALKRIFTNPERFNELNAEYVVLIVKEKILGFVTLGKIKSTSKYSVEKLEIVNSLAISCFIALNNAMMFSEIVRQKDELEERYNKLLDFQM